MQLPLLMHILVLIWVQFTWMKLVALAKRPNLLTALEALLSTVTMATEMMLEYDVKVGKWNNSKRPNQYQQAILFMYDYHFLSNCQWKLYLWRCSSGGRVQSV